MDAVKIDKLLELGEVEIATGYFGYKVEYFGKDAKGSDKNTLTKAWSRLRMYMHYVGSKGPSPFEINLCKNRKRGKSTT